MILKLLSLSCFLGCVFIDLPSPSPAVAGELEFEPRVVGRYVSGASSVYPADLDDDGDLDVISSSWNDGRIVWHENNRTKRPQFSDNTISTSAEGAESIIVVDLDSDGDLDVVSASFLDSRIIWFENNGGRHPDFVSHTITGAALGARFVSSADLDGDGDFDILSACVENDEISWYESNGKSPPRFTYRQISNTAESAWMVQSSDVDRDGDLDVISASAGDHEIAWHENDGRKPPRFTTHTVTSKAYGARAVYPGDLDSDGDVDLIVATDEDGKVSWYENDGSSDPSFRYHLIATTIYGAQAVHATDMDSDGDVDVLSSSFHGSWGVPFLSPDSAVFFHENLGRNEMKFITHTVVKSHGGSSVHIPR